jgi:hypothetical protein
MRIILRQPNQLHEWHSLDLGVSSELLRVDCFRTVVRIWRNHQLDDEEFESNRTEVAAMLRNIELRMLNPQLAKAAAALDFEVIGVAA